MVADAPTMTVAAEWYAALFLIIAGASHVAAPRAWARLFQDLLGLPCGGLAVGLLYLLPALSLLVAHPAWRADAGLIVTILAWAWTIKGTLYLLRPSLPARIAARHPEHPERFVRAGVVLIVRGGGVVAARLSSHGSPPAVFLRAGHEPVG